MGVASIGLYGYRTVELLGSTRQLLWSFYAGEVTSTLPSDSFHWMVLFNSLWLQIAPK